MFANWTFFRNVITYYDPNEVFASVANWEPTQDKGSRWVPVDGQLCTITRGEKDSQFTISVTGETRDIALYDISFDLEVDFTPSLLPINGRRFIVIGVSNGSGVPFGLDSTKTRHSMPILVSNFEQETKFFARPSSRVKLRPENCRVERFTGPAAGVNQMFTSRYRRLEGINRD